MTTPQQHCCRLRGAGRDTNEHDAWRFRHDYPEHLAVGPTGRPRLSPLSFRRRPVTSPVPPGGHVVGHTRTMFSQQRGIHLPEHTKPNWTRTAGRSATWSPGCGPRAGSAPLPGAQHHQPGQRRSDPRGGHRGGRMGSKYVLIPALRFRRRPAPLERRTNLTIEADALCGHGPRPAPVPARRSVCAGHRCNRRLGVLRRGPLAPFSRRHRLNGSCRQRRASSSSNSASTSTPHPGCSQRRLPGPGRHRPPDAAGCGPPGRHAPSVASGHFTWPASRSAALVSCRVRQPLRLRAPMSGDPHGEVGGDGKRVEGPADGAVTGAVDGETGGDRCHDHDPAGD